MKVYGLVRLTKDPEFISGTTKLSIAWNDYKKNGHFFNAVAFRKTGEAIYANCNKGDRIFIKDAYIENNNYKKQDDTMVYGNQIIINQFEFIEPKNQGNDAQKEVYQNVEGSFRKKETTPTIDVLEDDLPF